MKIFNLVIIASLILSACSLGQKKAIEGFSYKDGRAIKYEVQQHEIIQGMSQDELIKSLGEPSVITKDAVQNETWLYEHIAKTASLSTVTQRGGEANGQSQTKLLLTSIKSLEAQDSMNQYSVVIKFNSDKKIDSFTFHQSLH